ncbi:MAG TPA: LutB/LldF family L-lactate oxidation iron-sulfur protein [Bryobacteraceae bacterium]|nr:LutB/LldF family L-lactate oxidation iron-sulfur protein [Bryobacteraceae bacterium]
MKTPDVSAALGDKKLQLAIYSATGRMAERRREIVAQNVLPDYQDLRQHAHNIKKHTLDHLDYYLEQLERSIESRGGKVIWAKDGAEACAFIQKLARERGVKVIVKSKSMTTEEIDLNEHLEQDGRETVETDLGEYILQLAGEKPFHIIAPALHKTKEDVSGIFEKHLHSQPESTPEGLTKIARIALREKFLQAGLGITGANFLVADSGAVVIVENEGNARLSCSAPKIHVAVAGIEKLIPRAQDLGVFLKLLARSATGQALSVYTSFVAGAKRSGEPDGPEEFYLVLLDNGRTKLLADQSKRQSLYCIRCGACLNHCPVYRKIGGYNYPWVYSGPIGKILTPQFKGFHDDPWVPFASSLCGACGEVCPVKIEIPRILLELRADIAKQEGDRAEKLAFRIWAWVMRHPKLFGRLGSLSSAAIESLPGFLAVGPIKNWLSQRDLPEPPKQSFRDWWKKR